MDVAYDELVKKTNEAAHKKISAWLNAEGHRTDVEVHDERYADIVFSARGYRLSVRVDETDPGFLYIILRLDMPDDVTDELIARRAAAAVEAYAKVVKVEINWESRGITLATEQLVATPGGSEIFWRTVSFLILSVSQLERAFEDEAGHAAAGNFTQQMEAELSLKETR
jgi:hypothetical protein